MTPRLTSADVDELTATSRHDAATAPASARAGRSAALAQSLLPALMVLVPIAVDAANAHRNADLLHPATVLPLVAALCVIVSIGVVRALRGDIAVTESSVRVRGWRPFAPADVHEVLPVVWGDHSGPRRIELAILAADGRLLAALDSRRYRRDDLLQVLRRFAGKVAPAVAGHLGDTRAVRSAHPESRDRRSITLAVVQWGATVLALVFSGVSALLTLA